MSNLWPFQALSTNLRNIVGRHHFALAYYDESAPASSPAKSLRMLEKVWEYAIKNNEQKLLQ